MSSRVRITGRKRLRREPSFQHQHSIRTFQLRRRMPAEHGCGTRDQLEDRALIVRLRVTSTDRIKVRQHSFGDAVEQQIEVLFITKLSGIFWQSPTVTE